MRIGGARVSATEQNLGLQHDDLKPQHLTLRSITPWKQISGYPGAGTADRRSVTLRVAAQVGPDVRRSWVSGSPETKPWRRALPD